MKWLYFLAALGVNSLAYSAIVAFFLKTERFSDRHPILFFALFWVLAILSLPGCLIFGLASNVHSERVFKVIDKEKRAIRAVAEQKGRPSAPDQKFYDWEVERFIDDYDNFDLQRWKAHEYEKLGL